MRQMNGFFRIRRNKKRGTTSVFSAMDQTKSVWLLLNIFLLIIKVAAVERELTISVDPGREECFYENIREGQILDVEYQVIDGGHGEMDINFKIISPSGIVLITEYKKMDAVHRQEVKEEGDFKICFDNTFSRISTKVIYFEIIIENSDDDDDDSWDDNVFAKGITPEEVYEMRIEEIEEVINRVRNSLTRVKHMQDQLRAFEARDRNSQEHNYNRVNTWSIIQIFVMLSVGALQVFMLRSLFDDKSKIHHIWKSKS